MAPLGATALQLFNQILYNSVKETLRKVILINFIKLRDSELIDTQPMTGVI
jgi:hypothetical protein